MKTIEFKVSGLTCGACVSHVSKALLGVSGVRSAVVNLARGTALVSGEYLDKTALMAAVEEEGYGVTATEPTSPETAIPLTAIGCSCL